MSGLTGLDPLEAAIVLTCHEIGATPDGAHHHCVDIVDEVERRHGYGPRRAYDALLVLSQPWMRWTLLIDGHGNFGSPSHPAAEARYTEARLTTLGALAAVAERDEGVPLPFGLVDGTLYRGGSVAPAGPAVLDVLTSLAKNPELSDEEIAAVLGVPAFPSGCDVEVGDGHLRLTATMTALGDDIELTNFPPPPGGLDVSDMLRMRARQARIRDVNDVSVGLGQRVIVTPERGANPELVMEELRDIWGVFTIVRASPLSIDAIWQWMTDHWRPETLEAIEVIRSNIEERGTTRR